MRLPSQGARAEPPARTPRLWEQRRAFTLIELLVVIAIIGILAGLLLPSLARAKHSARKAACLSHLHQIGLGFEMYLGDHRDRFPDRRDLKKSLGYRPWTAWPASDPRGGWAAVVLTNELPSDGIWMCPAVWNSPLRQVPQTLQEARPGDPDSAVSYWLWRFDRADDPIPLDNFWGKTPAQALHDLRVANNPHVGMPESLGQVELVVDPYFPGTIPSLPPEIKGLAVHPGGRNVLMLDGHAQYVRDRRIK